MASGQSENTQLKALLAQIVSFYCLGLCADSQAGTARICLGVHQWTDRQSMKCVNMIEFYSAMKKNAIMLHSRYN